MAFHVNGVLRDTDYHRVTVSPDSKAVNYVRAECFTKEVLKSIMGRGYSTKNSRCVIAYDDVVQEMMEKKVLPESNLYWREPQVVRLKWECMGTPQIFKGDYAIDCVVRDSGGRKNCQRNTILIVRVKKAKELASAAAQVVVGEIILLGIFSQGSSSASSPPRKRRAHRGGGHEVPDDDDDNADDGNGGEYGGSGGGGGGGGGGKKGAKWGV